MATVTVLRGVTPALGTVTATDKFRRRRRMVGVTIVVEEITVVFAMLSDVVVTCGEPLPDAVRTAGCSD